MSNKKYCENCQKEISKAGWSEHCKTKKHLNNVNKDGDEPKKLHICKECDKSFNQASGLSRHKKQIHEGITGYGYYCTKHRLSDAHFKVLRSPEFYEQFKAENRKIKTVIKLNEKVGIKRTTEYKPKKTEEELIKEDDEKEGMCFDHNPYLDLEDDIYKPLELKDIDAIVDNLILLADQKKVNLDDGYEEKGDFMEEREYELYHYNLEDAKEFIQRTADTIQQFGCFDESSSDEKTSSDSESSEEE
eukprot:gene6308-10317_t